MSDLVSQNLNMIFKTPKGETVHALKDVSFTLKKGELLTVLGPSGCGKTTLLNITAGFLRPTSGKITLNNNEIDGPGVERGMVFQQGALFEWLTVAENVNFGLRMKKEDSGVTAKKVEEWLDIVGLKGFENTPTYQLSGGMQQRVALARCLINDPDLNESYKISKGVEMARKLLIDLAKLNLPAGTEFLDPISPQYITDIISWGAIGARTAESQIHRELASGLSCPVGIKNATNGSLKAAIDGIQAANHSHVFLGATKEADIAMLKTAGNSDAHIILRGGKEPNYDADSVSETLIALKEAEVNESIMIDASHGNSQKQFKRQLPVVESISDQIADGNKNIKGVMIESHLVEGNQKISENLTYGQSVTDGCVGWEDTLLCLQNLNEAVDKRRGQ